MAHNIRPQHRPHEQLRTEAPTQKKHTDKYVSAFVSSDNYVDMSFSSPLLQESADHYRVGVDELTVNLSHLSILEHEGEGKVLFRIRRLGYVGDDNHPGIAGNQQPDLFGSADDVDDDVEQGSIQANNGFATRAQARSLEFRIDRQYNTIAQILERAQAMCSALRAMLRQMVNRQDYDADNADTYAKWNLEFPADQRIQDVFPYISIDLTAGGFLRIRATAHFWANFMIEIPEPKYQHLLFGPKGTQLIALNPATGATYEPYDLTEDNPELKVPDNWYTTTDPLFNFRSITGDQIIAKSLDRRVAIEVGCSLPLKNSPMFDHGQESPDFVIGRFFMQNTTEGSANLVEGTMSIGVPNLGAKQLCGPKDRVCYHHLGPQQKIQMLRLRLWARVRSYDASNNKWSMKTIQMPVVGSDFWHIKLHFRPKDGRY